MWEMIGSFGFMLLKYFLEKKAARKLNDEELIKHVTAYQKMRTQNVVKQTKDFKANMEQLLAQVEAEEKEKEESSTGQGESSRTKDD